MYIMFAVKGKIKDIDHGLKTLKMLQDRFIVQLLNPDSIPSIKFLKYMACITKKKFKKNQIASNISTEFLLLIAGEHNINKAIIKVGVKNPNNVLLVADCDDKTFKEVIRKLGFEKHSDFNVDNSNINDRMYSNDEIKIENSIINLMG